IAEPWDCGPGGYQVGGFPPGWAEWNDRFRDTVRAYWRGDEGQLGELAARISGSGDLFNRRGRRPHAGINFVTAHDGFTLSDLVSYNKKRNQANGDHNRDGEDHNRSWNSGVEGPTKRVEVLKLRARQRRNMLATLFLSQGIPMLLGGDEMGRTQRGNNNAYCQDNEVSWYDWDSVDRPLLAFTRRLIKLRHDHPVFRRRRFFQGRPLHGSGVSDIGWFTPEGTEMTEADWSEGLAKSMAVFFNGEAVPTFDMRGDRVVDDTFFLLINGHAEQRKFVLPTGEWGELWVKVLDTTAADEAEESEPMRFKAGQPFPVEALSVLLLRRV
ncbi:MAG TPA: glycogen debranching enzyme, partial [Actinomycetota bacterium]|nr:glycogen debranching enzyme [Actinomycetota bacterium]